MRLALLAYGALFALIFLLQLATRLPINHPLTFRADHVVGATRELDRGGPPLTRYDSALGRRLPVASTDDKGLFLFLPVVGHLVGETDARTLFKWWYFAPLLALVLVSYPLVFYELFGSVTAGALAPFLFAASLPSLVSLDTYWMLVWATAFGLPLVLVCYRRWTRMTAVPLTALVVLGSFATSFRVHAGLPLLIAALLVVFTRERAWSARLSLAAVMLVAYVSVSHVTLAGVRSTRDDAVGVKPFDGATNVGHPFWHPTLLGLGFFRDNPYGLSWRDGAALAAARRVDPNVVYLSPHYNQILRHLYVHIVKANPGFVVNTYVDKAFIALDDAGRLPLAFVFVPPMLLLGPRRKRYRVYVLGVLPALLVGLASPVLSIPAHQYELGWLGAVLLLSLLAWSWLVAEGLALARAGIARLRSGSWRPATIRSAPRVWVALGATVVGAAVAAAAPAAIDLVRDDAYWHGGGRAVSSAVVSGPTAVHWPLGGGVPFDWVVPGGSAVHAEGGSLVVETSPRPTAYQLISPAVTLSAGRYLLVVRGTVDHGGIDVGALDAGVSRWIATSPYSQYSGSGPGKRLSLAFELTEPTAVRVILTNWARRSTRSRWRLREVAIVRGWGPLAAS